MNNNKSRLVVRTGVPAGRYEECNKKLDQCEVPCLKMEEFSDARIRCNMDCFGEWMDCTNKHAAGSTLKLRSWNSARQRFTRRFCSPQKRNRVG